MITAVRHDAGCWHAPLASERRRGLLIVPHFLVKIYSTEAILGKPSDGWRESIDMQQPVWRACMCPSRALRQLS